MTTAEYQAETRYAKVAEALRQQILSGVLKPGDRLPSFPVMRAQGISQNTLERAHTMLEREGLIVRASRRGVFVSKPRAAKASRLLAVLTHRTSREHPYYVHLLQGVQNEAHRRGCEVLLLNDDAPPQWERIDGLIMMGVRDFGLMPLPEGLPAVALMQPIPGVASVMVDERQGIIAAVNHLLQLGHRRIAFLGMPPDSAESAVRVEAYRATLQAGGVTPEAAWEYPLRLRDEPMRSFEELGREKMREWLQHGWAEMGCTALLAQNDDTAVGIVESFREHGVNVPADVSVIGFDGLEFGKYFRPRLTTVAVPLEEVGARGVALLLAQGSDSFANDSTRVASVLPVHLEIRDSTAPCR